MHQVVFLVHIGSLCVALFGIVLADRTAFAWLRGVRMTLNERDVARAHWVVTTGLTGLVLSGLYLFWPMRAYLLGEPVFWFKMTFVLALLVNSFFVERLMLVPAEHSFASLSRRQRLPLLVSGAVSTLCWVGAATAAFFLF